MNKQLRLICLYLSYVTLVQAQTIDKTTEINKLGTCESRVTKADANGNRQFINADIILYEKEIKDKEDATYSKTVLTTEEMLGTVAVHESEHATNIKAVSYIDENDSDEAEKLAKDKENVAIKELTSKH